VVALDLFQVVAVVDHQRVRLAQALERGVGQPVDPIEAGAVAEMEARHRIERPAIRRLDLKEVLGRQRQQRCTQPVLRRRARVPARRCECGELNPVCRRYDLRIGRGQHAVQPAREARRRRQRDERGEARQLAHQVLFPPIPAILRPVMHLNLQLTCALLPQPIREIYGLQWGTGRQHIFDLSARSMRTIIPRLPMYFRELPITRRLIEEIVG